MKIDAGKTFYKIKVIACNWARDLQRLIANIFIYELHSTRKVIYEYSRENLERSKLISRLNAVSCLHLFH